MPLGSCVCMYVCMYVCTCVYQMCVCVCYGKLVDASSRQEPVSDGHNLVIWGYTDSPVRKAVQTVHLGFFLAAKVTQGQDMANN